MSRMLLEVAKDPPDPRYHVVARMAAVHRLPTVIKPGRGLPARVAHALSALQRSEVKLIDIAGPLQSSVNREGGAQHASDRKAEKMQIAAAPSYALRAAKLLNAQRRLLAAAAKALRLLPLGRQRPTSKEDAAFRRALQQDRLSRAGVALARRAGISASELRFYRLGMLLSPDPPRLSPAQTVGDPKLAGADTRAAGLLRAFAKYAPKYVASHP